MWQCEIITKSSATTMTMWGRLVTLVWISEQTIETESNNIKFTKCFAILLAENICKKFTEAWLWWSFLQQILASTCYWLLEYQLIIDWGSCWKFKILISFSILLSLWSGDSWHWASTSTFCWKTAFSDLTGYRRSKSK